MTLTFHQVLLLQTHLVDYHQTWSKVIIGVLINGRRMVRGGWLMMNIRIFGHRTMLARDGVMNCQCRALNR